MASSYRFDGVVRVVGGDDELNDLDAVAVALGAG